MNLATKIVRFGVFQADMQRSELLRNGIPIKLQDQPFQILRLLLERRGDLVTREELRDALWPDGTFVDFDHSLNASINKLREALGDSASQPRFIQTIPRRGYRFIAPADIAQDSPEPQPPLPLPPPERSKRGRLARAAAVTLIFGVVLTIFGVVLWWGRGGAPEQQAEVVLLTTDPGMEAQPSFSPDGNYVVYAGLAPEARVQSLYLKQIGSENIRRLTWSSANDTSPKWSPDGLQIAFVRYPGRRDGAWGAFDTAVGTLMTAPALGGTERPIPQGQVAIFTGLNYRLLDWLGDSEHIVVSDNAPAERIASLFILNTRTGKRHRLTEPPVGFRDLDPAVSPDGRRIIFTRYGTNTLQSDIYMLQLTPELRASREARRLVSSIQGNAAAWLPDGRQIVFGAGPQHRKRLMRMRVDPPSSPALLLFGAEGTSSTLSAAVSKQNQIAYSDFRSRVYMYRSELGRDGTAIRTQRLTMSSRIDHLPDYSPSGDQIAFVSNRSGAQEMWISQADGSNARQLTSLRGKPEATWPRWSPDGRRLVFTGGQGVYLIDVQGGLPVQLATGEGSQPIAEWSRDGQSIYLMSSRTDRNEIWQIPAFDRHGQALTRQITRNGGGVPRMSPDGEFLYYATMDRPSELWRVPANGGREQVVVPSLANTGSFTVTATGVYFIPPPDENGQTAIMVLDPRTGFQKRIAPVDGRPMWGLAVSPDRRSMLHVAVEARPESDLMLVTRFQ